MPFELNKAGNIDCLPLLTWETAVIADVVCLLRLTLARHADEPEKNAVSVQLTMSPEQMDGLAAVLQQISAKIRADGVALPN